MSLIYSNTIFMDIHFIRENTDVVKTNQQNRFKDPALVDKILGK